MKLIDLSGAIYGNLWVINRNVNVKCKKTYWNCKCKCGTITSVRATDLKSGNTKNCGCQRTRYRLPFEWIYNNFKHTAYRKNIHNTISYDNFLTFTKITYCHYCNGNIEWTPHSNSHCSKGYNLDRIDSSKEYSMNNCVVCCYKCNLMKNVLSQNEFLFHITNIYNHQKVPNEDLQV